MTGPVRPLHDGTSSRRLRHIHRTSRDLDRDHQQRRCTMNMNTLHPLRYLPVLVLMAACAPSSGPYSSATTGALGGPADTRTASAGALSGSSIMPQAAP